MSWVLSGLALCVACGSSDDGLFGGGQPDASSGGSGGAAGAIGGAAGSAGQAASGGLDAGSGGSAGSTPDAADDGSVCPDGACDGAAGQSGAGGSGGDPGIGTGPCNGPSCNFASGQSCCVADGKGAACIAATQPCTCGGVLCDSVRIRCDGHEDCGGQICCAEFGLTSGKIERIECRATCQTDFTTRREVCDPAGPPCKNGSTCTPLTTLPPGYAICSQ